MNEPRAQDEPRGQQAEKDHVDSKLDIKKVSRFRAVGFQNVSDHLEIENRSVLCREIREHRAYEQEEDQNGFDKPAMA